MTQSKHMKQGQEELSHPLVPSRYLETTSQRSLDTVLKPSIRSNSVIDDSSVNRSLKNL